MVSQWSLLVGENQGLRSCLAAEFLQFSSYHGLLCIGVKGTVAEVQHRHVCIISSRGMLRGIGLLQTVL